MLNPADYFKEYRSAIGFSSQGAAKSFLSAKDIAPGVDYDYIVSLNQRIQEVLVRVNDIAEASFKRDDMEAFCRQHVFRSYSIIKDANLLTRLNNQGRRPEDVLFSWLRGYAVCQYFTPAFEIIFDASRTSIKPIGDDDLKSIDTFKRSPKADLEIEIGGENIRVEVQSGFQGVNDIKEHKVREAKRVSDLDGVKTICIHIDLFNGQVAFVRLDAIAGNDLTFVTRIQMGGQSVFSIDQNYFKWHLLDAAPDYRELEL